MRWRVERKVLQSPLRDWFFFALFVQLFFATAVGTNPASRWATLCALVEDKTVRIDAYVEHTIDWARTPDGHYYSNKAPGPALLGLPVFWALDGLQTWGVAARPARDALRYEWRGFNLRLLSLLLQILPFFFLVALWLGKLERADVSVRAQAATAAALLLGTTGVVFLNSYFGHGMAVVFGLGLLYAVTERSVFWTAFFFGMGLLCDYGSSLLLLPLLPLWTRSWWKCHHKIHWLMRFALGAALPAVLWVAYHQAAFGNPFWIATRFQNPAFVDSAAEALNLWGVLALPDRNTLFELSLGPTRGLLFTQPWVLFFLAAAWMIPMAQEGLLRKPQKYWVQFAAVSFLLLFLMNAAFGAWHAGNSPGPRYLSVGLVLCAAALGWMWDAFSPEWERRMWWLLALTAVLQRVFLWIYLGCPGPEETLWSFYRRELTGEHAGTPLSRLAVGVPLVLYLFWKSWRSTRRPESRNNSPPLAQTPAH